MKSIFSYIRGYFYETDKRLLFIASLLVAVLIFLNYQMDWDPAISRNREFLPRLISRYALFLLAFGFPYLLLYTWLKKKNLGNRKFLVLLFVAPALFAFKTSFALPNLVGRNQNWRIYWEYIIYWPLLVIIVGTVLYFIWKKFDREQPFYGLTTRGINWQPYWIMLLIMLPLVAAASTQPDFLTVYPKLKTISGVFHEPDIRWWHKLLFEISYGTDFITIELFFRGFLILAFVKWAGKDAILPMACFYCTIHFGKPLGECISSYFGGMILGIIVYHTRSIFGGLIVHLGIAWLMELGGHIGNAVYK